jgi:YVTN family beta-propeller protein
MGTISFSHSLRNLISYGNKLYVSNFSGNYIGVIDTNTDTIVNSIITDTGPYYSTII